MVPSESFVLVDTSVFVEFFRKGFSPLKALIADNRVAISAYSRLELIRGVRKNERQKLVETLDGLIITSHHPNFFQDAEKLLIRLNSVDVKIGLIDILILLSAKVEGFPIYSLDKKLLRCADAIQVRTWS